MTLGANFGSCIAGAMAMNIADEFKFVYGSAEIIWSGTMAIILLMPYLVYKYLLSAGILHEVDYIAENML